MLHQKVLIDPIELNKLLAIKMKPRKESSTTRRLSLPTDAMLRKNEKMPKLATKKVSANKSMSALKDDIFDFNDSVAELEAFPAVEKTYTAKRKVMEKNESISECFFFSIFVVCFICLFGFKEVVKK